MANEQDILKKDDEELRRLQDEYARLMASEQFDQQQQQQEDPAFPLQQEKESFYKFFRDILKSKDSTKTANLDRTELGNGWVTVLGSKDLSLYCDLCKLNIVGNYFRSTSEDMNATSMSKKGFFLTNVVTQIKKTSTSEEKQKVKKGWFSNNKGGDDE